MYANYFNPYVQIEPDLLAAPGVEGWSLRSLPGRARLVTSLTLPVSPPSPPALAPPGPYPT